MTHVSNDLVRPTQLDFEGWRAFLRASCGNWPEVKDPSAFVGWVRPRSVWGLAATTRTIDCGLGVMASGQNSYRSERTYQDVRSAGADYYYAVFQVAGQSVFTQNDEVSQLAVGDIALLDAARPAACFTDHSQWLRFQLPREDRGPRKPLPTCSWRSMISLVRYLRRPRRCLSHVMRTGYLPVSAASSRTALPIRISARAGSQPKQGSRCAICRSSLPRGV